MSKQRKTGKIILLILAALLLLLLGAIGIFLFADQHSGRTVYA